MVTCLLCNGPLCLLGALGGSLAGKRWYRCRNCGTDQWRGKQRTRRDRKVHAKEETPTKL